MFPRSSGFSSPVVPSIHFVARILILIKWLLPQRPLVLNWSWLYEKFWVGFSILWNHPNCNIEFLHHIDFAWVLLMHKIVRARMKLDFCIPSRHADRLLVLSAARVWACEIQVIYLGEPDITLQSHFSKPQLTSRKQTSWLTKLSQNNTPNTTKEWSGRLLSTVL